MSSAHILVVDDEPDIRQLVQEILEDEGYSVTVAENGTAARQARRERKPDLVLLDIWMDDIDGITLLREWAETGGLSSPVIMMSGHATVETAVEATRLGAYDFIEKPISLAKLLLTIQHALQADHLARENVGLKQQEPVVTEPVGRSAVMQGLKQQAERIAPHDTSVFLMGDSGAGKKTIAHYIHQHSLRRNGPFIEVSVGSLSSENSALELFGAEDEGKLRYGRFEQANGGTLYIDDVADMDDQTQARLLSVLESGRFTRVGGSEGVRADTRIIAVTNKDIEQRVATGRFREELFYHLNVVPLKVPPLAEHCEDVPELLSYYVDYFVARENLDYRRFSMAAQNRLRNYAWPGNIRELKNLVQRLLILGHGEEIGITEVDATLQSAPVQASSGELLAGVPLGLPLREAREQFERLYLENQLKEVNGSVGQLSRKVGMERTHLYRKLKALGIDVKKDL